MPGGKCFRVPDGTQKVAMMSDIPAAPVLSDLAVGQGGRVVALTGSPDVRQRLREMGLTTGAHVEVVRRAPLGDPLDIRVRGYHLSVRLAEAACVCLEPAPADTGAVG